MKSTTSKTRFGLLYPSLRTTCELERFATSHSLTFLLILGGAFEAFSFKVAYQQLFFRVTSRCYSSERSPSAFRVISNDLSTVLIAIHFSSNIPFQKDLRIYRSYFPPHSHSHSFIVHTARGRARARIPSWSPVSVLLFLPLQNVPTYLFREN